VGEGGELGRERGDGEGEGGRRNKKWYLKVSHSLLQSCCMVGQDVLIFFRQGGSGGCDRVGVKRRFVNELKGCSTRGSCSKGRNCEKGTWERRKRRK
jgi:hypothetical protein